MKILTLKMIPGHPDELEVLYLQPDGTLLAKRVKQNPTPFEILIPTTTIPSFSSLQSNCTSIESPSSKGLIDQSIEGKHGSLSESRLAKEGKLSTLREEPMPVDRRESEARNQMEWWDNISDEFGFD